MSNRHSDGRGSEEQRIIYDFLGKLYPGCSIYYEFPLDDRIRIDCFVLEHGIAVELDGRQHYEYVEHFHKDAAGYIDQVRSDKAKDRKLEEMGIKVIRVKQHECPSTKEELMSLIREVPDYDHYDYNEIKKQQNVQTNKKYLDIAREIRRSRYKYLKQQRGNK